MQQYMTSTDLNLTDRNGKGEDNKDHAFFLKTLLSFVTSYSLVYYSIFLAITSQPPFYFSIEIPQWLLLIFQTNLTFMEQVPLDHILLSFSLLKLSS